MKMPIERLCGFCGRQFLQRFGLYNPKKGKVCSKSCAAKSMVYPPIVERFWAKVNKTPTCWLWTAAKDKHGYGCFSDEKRRVYKAHRFSWFFASGEWPSLDVLHKCDNPPCIRPDHLFLGTQKQNVMDMVSKRRHVHGERTITSKLTVSQVIQICEMFATGLVLQKDIAATFGVCRATVSMILSGKRWALTTEQHMRAA